MRYSWQSMNLGRRSGGSLRRHGERLLVIPVGAIRGGLRGSARKLAIGHHHSCSIPRQACPLEIIGAFCDVGLPNRLRLHAALRVVSPPSWRRPRGGSGERRMVPSRPHVDSGPDPAIYSRVRSQGGPACPENFLQSRAPADGLRRGLAGTTLPIGCGGVR